MWIPEILKLHVWLTELDRTRSLPAMSEENQDGSEVNVIKGK